MNRVQLQPYTIVWPWLFRKEKILLRALFRRRILDIQHIGSTAIPDMIAKPVIDILVAVAHFETAAECIQPIKRLGYEYKGESMDLRQYYFVKGQPTAYHLYMVEPESETWTDRIFFRDYLCQHPDVARHYADLKRELAEQFATDRRAYQERKLGFVNQVLRMRV